MKRLVLSLLVALGLAYAAFADTSDAAPSEADQVLQAAWGAALILPQDKQARLAPAFLEIAFLSGESDLLQFWEQRLGHSYVPLQTYPDYGWQIAEPILRQGGVSALIDMANRRADPLSFGRADALLAAGKHLTKARAEEARQINQALLDLTRSASQFEQVILAHAAAELAMTRCDPAMFDQAERATTAPGNLRYAFWRARMSGSVSHLFNRVRGIDNEEDTSEVRRVLEGYRAIQELGYCAAPKS